MRRVLVIGSETKSKKYESVKWLDLKGKVPTLGDYDDIVFVLPTLTLGVLSIIPIQVIKSKIGKAILNETTFYVLTAPQINAGGHHNYSFLPFNITYINEDGEMFKEIPEDNYFKKVNRWDFCFSYDATYPDTAEIGWDCTPIAVTKHGNLVSFSMRVINLKTYVNPTLSNNMLFFPPQTNVSINDNIENLLNIINPPENKDNLPPFIKELKTPGEAKLLEEVSSNQSVILEKGERNSEIMETLKELDIRKSILSSKGTQLVDAVVKVFKDLDIILEGEEKFEEDKMLLSGKNKIPVEIKGHDKGATEEDLRQAFARKNKAVVEDGVKPKAILIVNAFANLPLEQRGKDFEDSIVSKETGWEVGLLSTRELYKFWEESKKTGKNSLLEKLLNNTGLIKFS